MSSIMGLLADDLLKPPGFDAPITDPWCADRKEIRTEAFAEVVELINYKQRRVFSNILRRNMNEWERGYRYALDELEGDVKALKGR